MEYVDRIRQAQRAAVCWKRRLDAPLVPATKEVLKSEEWIVKSEEWRIKEAFLPMVEKLFIGFLLLLFFTDDMAIRCRVLTDTPSFHKLT